MKIIFLAVLLLASGSAFAADATPAQLARILQIKSVQSALSKVPGSADQIAVTYEMTGGMETAGYVVSISLTGRADKDAKTLKDCEITIGMFGPKYKENGEQNDISFNLTNNDLRTISVSTNSCVK